MHNSFEIYDCDQMCLGGPCKEKGNNYIGPFAFMRNEANIIFAKSSTFKFSN